MNLVDLVSDLFARAFQQNTRALRLRLAGRSGNLFNDTLIPQRLELSQAVCDGLTLHLTCLANRADLPLKELLGLPIEVQLVTDEGSLQRHCAVITEVRQGQSDGSLTTLQLTARDIFAVMEGRRSNRVFLNKSVTEIVRIVLDGWRQRFPAVAHAFDYQLLDIDEARYPARAFTFQANQSDADFLRGLLKRNGIAWFFRAGPDAADNVPAQQLVLFDDGRRLSENTAGAIRFHRLDGTEKRDTIHLLAPTHTLSSSAVKRSSYDHESVRVDVTSESTVVDQGEYGNALAAALEDARIQLPHAGDSWDDHRRLTRLDMQRHEFRAQCLHGRGGVRAQTVGEWNRIDGHPLLDMRSDGDRQFITIELQLWAENNLPKELSDRTQELLLASAQHVTGWVATKDSPREEANDSHRFQNRFIAVQRDVPIAPWWDPETDLPRIPLITAIVVGPDNEPVWCDELGRVKVAILGLDAPEHEHASGAGVNGNDGDSAWVRVDTLWAGEGYGVIFPLRAGMEVSLGFEQGDPSRPVITGSRYNFHNVPPRFDHLGDLPGNRALSGIVTRELKGQQQQQLRFNDSSGNISVQLASDHATSQLNLGSISSPMNKGDQEPRGEGAELRSDASVAIRGAQGILVSSSAQLGAIGNQLARTELIGLAKSLQGVAEQLNQLAQDHQAIGTDQARFKALVRNLESWEHGSTTEPTLSGGGSPIVAITGAAGTTVLSQDSLLLGAQTHSDFVSVGHTQISSGKQIRHRASTGISSFAHSGGIENIAGDGNIEIQAQSGEINITSSDTISLTASKRIIIQAPEVQIISKGAQTQWGSGSIIEQAKSSFVVQAAKFAQSAGGDGIPRDVKLPSSHVEYDQQVTLRWSGTNEPMKNQKYRVTTDTGHVFEGLTDALGLTERFKIYEAFGGYKIEVIQD